MLKIKVYFEAKKSGLEAEVGGLAGGQTEPDFEPRGGPGKKPKSGDKRSDGCMKKKKLDLGQKLFLDISVERLKIIFKVAMSVGLETSGRFCKLSKIKLFTGTLS